MTDSSLAFLPRFFEAQYLEHLDVAERARRGLAGDFARLVEVCAVSLRGGGKLMFFGNGGSAADSQHIATEFSVRYRKDRPAMSAMALTVEGATMTAIGNDLGFEHLFARQIEAFGRRGDVAIGISTSGRSRNVLLGLAKAREMGVVAAGLGGGDGGQMRGLADPFVVVPSPVTARIQEMHLMLGQMLCGALEIALGHAAPDA